MGQDGARVPVPGDCAIGVLSGTVPGGAGHLGPVVVWGLQNTLGGAEHWEDWGFKGRSGNWEAVGFWSHVPAATPPPFMCSSPKALPKSIPLIPPALLRSRHLCYPKITDWEAKGGSWRLEYSQGTGGTK